MRASYILALLDYIETCFTIIKMSPSAFPNLILKLICKLKCWMLMSLTYSGRGNISVIFGKHFEIHSLQLKFLYFDSNFTNVCFQGSNWQEVSIGSGNADDWHHETYVMSKKRIWIMAWSLLHELWMNGISLTRAQVKKYRWISFLYWSYFQGISAIYELLDMLTCGINGKHFKPDIQS